MQLHHRVLALSTLMAVCATWAAHRQAPLPRSPRLLLHALLGATTLQARLFFPLNSWFGLLFFGVLNGWQQSCGCAPSVVPFHVLDPTHLVAGM